MRRRYPIAFWTVATLSALFLVSEAYWVIQLVRHPCENCIDDGAILFYTALMFVVLVPLVGLAGLSLDALRTRLRHGTWRRSRVPPSRTDLDR